ncbi:MAG: UDP-N-acetylmuramoyl-L-alanine--D-glutamate ligase [Clostridia bacterium]|nr:UDP-N-acetylmuramoyl-L-alanine--D-glutamate ligase [Clostridia bacterium]
MKQETLLQYIGGRSCAILGLGVSHLPLARQLTELGISLTVHDKKSPEELGDAALSLAEAGVAFVTGDGYLNAIEGEVIFRSPGIRPDLGGIPAAIQAGAELTSEIELFLRLTEAETFAVTGSDGKTTSTTLTGKFLEAEAKRRGFGNVLVGGNIGAPLLDRLEQTDRTSRAVMELSSFQLMTLSDAPHHVAITNISPNHLDWHHGMEEYIKAKTHIVGTRTQRIVTNADNPETVALAKGWIGQTEERPPLILFSSTKHSYKEIYADGSALGDCAVYEKDGFICFDNGSCAIPLLEISHIRVPGRHNVENFMTAIALTFGCVDPSVYTTVADEFTGVEHRLELVLTRNGVDYFNSSIDSSPTRTAAALSALHGRGIVAICGGYDKKIPFAPLADALCRSVRAVVLTGATAEKIKDAILACPAYREGNPQIKECPDFEEAVRCASSLAKIGECVLLSPACASFDAFKNFAERGERFRSIVNTL